MGNTVCLMWVASCAPDVPGAALNRYCDERGAGCVCVSDDASLSLGCGPDVLGAALNRMYLP